MKYHLFYNTIVGFVSFISLALCLSACEIYNPEEEIPSYIHIDSILLTTNYATQGTSSHRITDAWVYVDKKLVGAFELPVTFPVLSEGTHQIMVGAGIEVNGIAATRMEYPFYSYYTENVKLEKAKVSRLKPNVTYFPGPPTDFIWKEDFEGQGISLSKSPESDTTVGILENSSDVFEGKKSGIITLGPQHPFFECVSPAIVLPQEENPVFLELNYKCNNLFVVGVYSSSNQLPSLYIKPSEKWNKIYINLTGEVRQGNSSTYKIFIGMAKDPQVDKPQLFLDNIKLIR